MQRLTRPALPVIEEGAAREDDVHVASASPGGAEPRVSRFVSPGERVESKWL